MNMSRNKKNNGGHNTRFANNNGKKCSGQWQNDESQYAQKREEAQRQRKAKEAEKIRQRNEEEEAAEMLANQNNMGEQANQELAGRGRMDPADNQGGGRNLPPANNQGGGRNLPPANNNADNQAQGAGDNVNNPPNQIHERPRPQPNDDVVYEEERNDNRFRNDEQYFGYKPTRFNYNRQFHFYKNRTWEKPAECKECARLRRERNEMVNKNSELQQKLSELTSKVQQLETESKMKEMVTQLMNERAAAMQALTMQRQQLAGVYQY